ncbi:MAG: hypothetical protein ABEK42_12230, partial [Thiohalorhabdaceae bacterium]
WISVVSVLAIAGLAIGGCQSSDEAANELYVEASSKVETAKEAARNGRFREAASAYEAALDRVERIKKAYP